VILYAFDHARRGEPLYLCPTRLSVTLLQVTESQTHILSPPQFIANHLKGAHLNLHASITPLISLIAGILILVMPKLLNFIVAIYLIIIGLVGLLGGGALRL
jgi:hypothetical protein